MKIATQPNPQNKVNIFSYVTFWWMNSFFAKGYRNQLNEEDMYKLDHLDKSYELCTVLERNWKKELEKNVKNKSYQPNLQLAVIKTYGLRFLFCGIFAVVEESLRIFHPMVVGWLIVYFQNHEENVKYAYIYASIISIISFILAIIHHVYFFHVQRIGWHLRSSMCGLMYKKTLRLSQKALAKTTTGQIVNLGASDVMRFDFLPLFLHYLWVGPAQCIVVVAILWQDLGGAVIGGMLFLAVTMILQSLIGRGFGKLRLKTAVITDNRVRLMSEIISGMRIIKMYNWEKSFADVVQKIRSDEVKKILMSSVLRAFNFTSFSSAAKLITFVTFVIYVNFNGELTTAKVFVAIGMFNVVRLSTGLFFPLAIEKTSESIISLKRIQSFLLLDEVLESQRSALVLKSSGDSFIHVKNLTAQWDDSCVNSDITCTDPNLIDITVDVEAGRLLAVIGPVGAGKSSFLSALLGEMISINGNVQVNGKISYASQIPWVFAGSFRDNILFGDVFDEDWYADVVKKCALKPDIDLLPEGDETLIGERGVTLSGGQKARISLARTLYKKDSDVILLDDPLSAVDAAVAKHLFEECICGAMKNKTRVLVTHQLQFLKDADQIMILKEGHVAGLGTFKELQEHGTDFAALLKKEEEEEVECKSPILQKKEIDFMVPRFRRQISRQESKRSVSSHARTASQGSISFAGDLDDFEDGKLDPLLGEDNLEMSEEEREQGSIEAEVYWEYFRVGAHVLFLIVMVIFILINHVSFVLADWWVGKWATDYQEFVHNHDSTLKSVEVNNTTFFNHTLPQTLTNFSIVSTAQTAITITNFPNEEFNMYYYIFWYAIIIVSMYLSMLIRSVMHFYLCVTSGIQMHKKMFQSILNAPIRFFDTNPVGRILNRFSKDMGQIDELLPITLMDFFYIFGLLLSIIVLACVINYIALVVVVPLVLVFLWIRHYYLRTSRDIKRIEGSSRSPVFSLLSSTLQGLTTVRAFQVQNAFEEKFHQYQDLHSSAWFLFLCGGRWLGARLDFLSAIFITTVAFSAVAASSLTDIEAAGVGLMLTYSILLLGMFQWGVRQSAEVENLMTSVERVQQYYKIPPEDNDSKVIMSPPDGWPSHGGIVFESASFAHFAGGPVVLKNITMNIRAQEKIGIVGRTGAGKSSLIAALFRFADLCDGNILIDGISISSVHLEVLRRALSIIPQDPILFLGTMRYNLDPFNQYEDSELWNALEQVELKTVVESLPLKLESELVESGTNFSVGQRQLVCLARAVLRKSKILVIDEATANVDLRTDRLIQETLRRKFKNCTVLTIAHRINTIIDSDRVLVLDAGKVVEFDSPYVLIKKERGIFKEMVRNTGEDEAQRLKNMSKQAHNKTLCISDNSNGVV